MVAARKNSKSAIDTVTFLCYLDGEGKNVIAEWYLGQTKTIQGDFVGVLEFLGQAAELRWGNVYKRLTRRAGSPDCEGLDEIRLWEDSKPREIHHRILVCREPSEHLRTMLHTLNKDQSSDYAVPCRCGQVKSREVKKDASRAEPYDFPPR